MNRSWSGEPARRWNDFGQGLEVGPNVSTDREYRIRIETIGDPGGAQSVERALNKTAGATENANKATQRHSRGLEEMRRMFLVLDGMLPGLGALLQAVFSPVGAAISIAVIALRGFQEHMRKLNDEFKRMEEEAAKPLTNRLEAMRESVVANAAGLAALDDRLTEAARAQQSLATETNQAVAAMHEQMNQAEALGEAQKGTELSILESLHSAGLISEQQYVEQKLAIEQAYLEKKRDMEERQQKNENTIRRRALERAEGEQPALVKAAEAAERKQTRALEDLGSLDKAGIEDRRKATAKALADWEHANDANAKRFEEVGKSATEKDFLAKAPAWGITHRNAARLFQGKYKTWQDLGRAAVSAEGDWEKLPPEEARLKVAADRATREAATAAQRATDQAKFIAGRDGTWKSGGKCSMRCTIRTKKSVKPKGELTTCKTRLAGSQRKKRARRRRRGGDERAGQLPAKLRSRMREIAIRHFRPGGQSPNSSANDALGSPE